MRIVTYNIQWAKGRDGRIDLARIARAVADADIIALQEVERNWRPQADPDQVQRLAELLPDHNFVFGPSLDFAGAGRGGRRQVGNMLLSRCPIAATRNLPLPSRPAPGEVNDSQAMIEAIIEAGSGLRVYNVHLNYLDAELRLEQLGLMLPLILEAPARGALVTVPDRGLGPNDEWIVPPPTGRFPPMPQAALLLGDFNFGPASREHDVVVAAGFENALTLAGLPPDEGVTFPGGGNEPPQRLDHIFLNGPLVPLFRSAWIDERADGSDHQPVWIDLQFPGGSGI